MSEEKIVKGMCDVTKIEFDINKCIEYENRILTGEDVVLEANKFVVDKAFEILIKSPEIIILNGVVVNVEIITEETALRGLAVVKKVLNDELVKNSVKLTVNSWNELKKK